MKISDKIRHIVRISTLLAMLVLAAGTMAVFAADGDGGSSSYAKLIIEKKVVGLPADKIPEEFDYTLEGALGGGGPIEKDESITIWDNNLPAGSVTVTENTQGAQVPGYTLTTTYKHYTQGTASSGVGISLSGSAVADLMIDKAAAFGDNSVFGGDPSQFTYTYRVTGPNGFHQTVTATPGQRGVLSGLSAGSYTISEDQGIAGFDVDAVTEETYEPDPGKNTKTLQLYEGSTLTISKPAELSRAAPGASDFIITGPNGFSDTKTLLPGETKTIDIPRTGEYTVTEIVYTPTEAYDITTYQVESKTRNIGCSFMDPKINSITLAGNYNEVLGFSVYGDTDATGATCDVVITYPAYADGATKTASYATRTAGKKTTLTPPLAVSGSGRITLKITPKDPGANGGAVNKVTLHVVQYTATQNISSAQDGESKTVVVDIDGRLIITKPSAKQSDSSVRYMYTIVGDNYSKTVILKDGESTTLEGLAAGEYTITQTINTSTTGFSLDITGPSSVSRSSSNSGVASSITIKKPSGDDGGRGYTFKVTVNGDATQFVTLKAGESQTIELAEGNAKYEVVEVDTSYTARLQSDGNTVYANDSDTPTVLIINTYTPEAPPPTQPVYEYGHYYYVHEYYLKNPDGTLTLEGNTTPVSSGSILLPDHKTYDQSDVSRLTSNNGVEYEYFEDAYGTYTIGLWHPDPDMTSVQAEPGNQIIILRYVRETPKNAGSYRVVHEYYFEDAYGERTLEGTSGISGSGELALDETAYTEADVGRENVFEGRTYDFDSFAYGSTDGTGYTPDSGMEYVVATENGEQIIILRYVRRTSGAYRVVHEYYFENADGTLSFEGRSDIGTVSGLALDGTAYTEETVGRENVFQERTYDFSSCAYGSTNGSEYDTDGGMTGVVATEDGSQIIILQYVRREGGYRVVHEYYLRTGGTDRFEGRSEISGVDGLTLGSQYDESSVGRVSRFQGHAYTYFQAAYGTSSGGSYAADGGMRFVVTTQNSEQIIILRYYREIVLPPDTPDPNDPDSPEEFTIEEDDIPTTYVKVWDPEEEEWFYVPEDDVPLFNRSIPETGDDAPVMLFAALAMASLAGLVLLGTFGKRRKAQ